MNSYITKIKSFVAMLVISSMALSMTACSGSTNNGTAFLDQIHSAEIVSEDDTSTEESSDAPTKEGFTETPKVLHVKNTAPRKVLVAGTCEENAEITVYNIAKKEDVFSTKANNKCFIMEIDIPENDVDEQTFVITAKIDGKELSEEAIFNAQFDAVANPSDISIVLGNDSTLFTNSLLNSYKSETLYSVAQLKDFKQALKKKGDSLSGVEVVYVVLPDALTTNEHIIPEEYKPQETVFNKKHQQLMNAISETDGFKVLDLTELFLSKNNGEYPLYYNTSSNLSDYGSYVTYNAIMEYIAGKDSTADGDASSAPSLDFKYKFDLLAGKGGNLIASLGLDNEVFTEEYYYATKDFVSTIPENSETNCSLADLIVYSDKSTNTLYTANSADSIVGANEYVYFKTNRPELPSAIFLRDNTTNPMVSMLAENFNNSCFKEAGMLSLDSIVNDVTSFATEGSANVDYIFVITSAENADSLYNSVCSSNS